MLINNPKWLLGNEPGTGKTPVAAYYSKYAWDYLKFRSAWTQPKSLLKKNKDEILRFTGWDASQVVVVEGTPKKRRELMATDAKVFLFTFQGWSNEWEILLDLHPDTKVNIIDEIHLGYVGHTSKRTQSWYIACRQMHSIIPMTGTIIKGRLSSCYPVLHAIAPQFYGSYESFMAQHALKDEFGTLIGWRNHDKLKNVLKAKGSFRSFAEVYGPEAKVIEVETIEMSDKHRAEYEKFEALALIELDDEFLDAGNPAVAAIRARQILAHPEFFKMECDRGKDERLMIHVEDAIRAGEKVVIYSALVPEQERIYAMLKKEGVRAGLINGSVSGKKRVEIDEAFRAGKLDMIVGSPATMAVGFNWGFLDTVIFVSLDYEDSSFIQAYRRGIRGKRSKPLRIIVMEYEKSIDQRIFYIVQRKSKDASLVDETKEELNLMGEQRAEKKHKSAPPSGRLSMGDL